MKILLIIYCCLLSSSLAAKTIFTYVAKATIEDPRISYEKRVLELALIKTQGEYGDFELIPSDSGITKARLQIQMKQGLYDNYFFKMSVTDKILTDYHVINFPIDLGLVGYRIAFVHQSNLQNLRKVTELEELKDLLILQGIGWLDGDILQANGLTVSNVTNKTSMYKMISLNRADLYFRGLNEIKNEILYNKPMYPEVEIEPYIVLHYPLPRFFVTSKENAHNAKRVELGLKKAYADGSLIKLWESVYLEDIQFINLNKRHVIELENPFISTLDPYYKKYNYKLGSLPTKKLN